MRRYKYQSINLKIKSDLLSNMIDACIYCREMTRNEIEHLSHTSQVTAGRLLSALDECGFTEQLYKRNPNGGSPEKLRVFGDHLSTLALDLSSKHFSFHLINGSGESKLFGKHRFDTTINPKENLTAFLSKTLSEVNASRSAISSLAIMVANDKRAYPYQLPNRDEILETVTAFFGIYPTVCTDRTEAVTFALKYKVRDGLDSGKTAYVHIGDLPFVAFFPDGGDAVTCILDGLLISDSLTVSEMIGNAHDEKDLGRILARIANFVYCAFSPDRIVIEYDNIRVGATALSQIKSTFAITGSPLPEIFISGSEPGLALLGASAAANAILIKKHVRGV